MKGIHIVSLAALVMLSFSCAEQEPVATGYKKALQSGTPAPANGNGNANPQTGDANTGGGNTGGANTGGGNTGGANTGGDQTGNTGGGDTGAGGGAGDATKGKALVDTKGCKNCHPGVGPALTKNSSTDKAVAAAQYHGSFTDVFSGQNLADLQAYLKSL